MAEIDTSSYKLPAQPSALDTLGKMQSLRQQQQGIEQGQVNIDRSKLELAIRGLGFMTNEINAVDPATATPQDFFRIGQRAVNNKFMTPESYIQFVKEIPTKQADVPKFIQEYNNRAKSIGEVLDWNYGQITQSSDGQTVTPGVVSRKPGFAGDPSRGGFVAISKPIQQQLPPGTPTVVNGQPTYVGATPPDLAPGTVSQPTPVNRPNVGPLPVGRDRLSDGSIREVGPNTAVAPLSFKDRFPQGVPAGNPPLYEEGKKAYSEDQTLATQKLTAVKPAITALSLMKDLRSGPGTETYNKAVAFMKANNIIPTTANDPTAIYQEVNKYLNQYVQGGGTRSDADLAQRELSNPNVSQQINPALVKLTKNTIALDRIQAARSGAFEGQDFSKYGKHRSTFPSSVSTEAFTIDLLEPQERQKLLGDMLKKKDTKEGQKFWKSLEIAKRSGVLQ